MPLHLTPGAGPTSFGLQLNQAGGEGVGPWSLVTLGLFVLCNLWLLRGIWRRLADQASELRESDERGHVVTEFALDRLKAFLFVGTQSNVGNPLQRARVEVWWIGFLLAADYASIKVLWPWLLP